MRTFLLLSALTLSVVLSAGQTSLICSTLLGETTTADWADYMRTFNKPTVDETCGGLCSTSNLDVHTYTQYLEDATITPSVATYCCACEAGVCVQNDTSPIYEAACTDDTKCTICSSEVTPPPITGSTNICGMIRGTSAASTWSNTMGNLNKPTVDEQCASLCPGVDDVHTFTQYITHLDGTSTYCCACEAGQCTDGFTQDLCLDPSKCTMCSSESLPPTYESAAGKFTVLVGLLIAFASM